MYIRAHRSRMPSRYEKAGGHDEAAPARPKERGRRYPSDGRRSFALRRSRAKDKCEHPRLVDLLGEPESAEDDQPHLAEDGPDREGHHAEGHDDAPKAPDDPQRGARILTAPEAPRQEAHAASSGPGADDDGKRREGERAMT